MAATVDADRARFSAPRNDRLAATGLDLDAATGEDRGSGGQSESLDHYDERGGMRVFGADVASRGTECGAGQYISPLHCAKSDLDMLRQHASSIGSIDGFDPRA